MTFYTYNTWTEKEFGKTIPLTISQFQQILATLKKLREAKKPKGITHKDILKHLNNMNNKFIIVDGRGGYPELRKVLPRENYIKI